MILYCIVLYCVVKQWLHSVLIFIFLSNCNTSVNISCDITVRRARGHLADMNATEYKETCMYCIVLHCLVKQWIIDLWRHTILSTMDSWTAWIDVNNSHYIGLVFNINWRAYSLLYKTSLGTSINCWWTILYSLYSKYKTSLGTFINCW